MGAPETPHEQDMGAWLQQFYASHDTLPAEFLAERHDQPAQERYWS